MTTLCARCLATGKIITPNHNTTSGLESINCPNCNGLGYIQDPNSIQIRDSFAISAMAAIISYRAPILPSEYDDISQKSYAMADAMMKARLQQKSDENSTDHRYITGTGCESPKGIITQVPDEPDYDNQAKDYEADQLWAAQPKEYDP